MTANMSQMQAHPCQSKRPAVPRNPNVLKEKDQHVAQKVEGGHEGGQSVKHAEELQRREGGGGGESRLLKTMSTKL